MVSRSVYVTIAVVFLASALTTHGQGRQLRGEITAVDVEERRMTLQHETYAGLFEAGETTFAVSRADAQLAVVGQMVRGTVVTGGATPVLDHVWPDDPELRAELTASAAALAEETEARGSRVLRRVGEIAPDFVLLDQRGEAVRLRDLEGQKVIVSFIFTRCRVQSMCPANTMRFVEMREQLDEAGRDDVSLILITFDPEYDSPGILADYATNRGFDGPGAYILTGPEAMVDDLLEQFGLLRRRTDGTIEHTSTTVILDERGRLTHRRNGTTWTVAEMLDALDTNPRPLR